MQNFTCIGRLTKDPEIKAVSAKDNTQIKVARYTVAVNRDREKDEADFFNCEVWRGGAEFAEKYLKQGKRVSVTGKIRQDHYDKDGQQKVAWKVIVESQEPIDWPEKDTQAQNATSGTAGQQMPYSAPQQMPNAPAPNAPAPAQVQATYAPAPNAIPAQPQGYPQNVYQALTQGQPTPYMPTQTAYAPVPAPVNPPMGYEKMPDFPEDMLPF